MKEEKKYAMLQLDVETHKKLKEYCKGNGFIMSTWVANLIKKSLKTKQYEMYNQIRKHRRWSY